MKIAAIDIGTNTVLLLIAELDSDGKPHFLHHEQRTPRLGKNVDAEKRIGIGAFDRIAWIVNVYKNIAQQWQAERIVSAATSAVRDASNREEFLAYLKQVTGIDTEVLSGEEEARLTFIGALSGLPGAHNYTVLDIGGGSTEFTYAEHGTSKLHRNSFQIGSVRLTERYFKHQPPLQEESKRAREVILHELKAVEPSILKGYELAGVAGTVTSLACFDQGLQEFDVEKVSGYKLSYDRVGYWLGKLSSKTPREIRKLSAVAEGREDILIAGALILASAMEFYEFSAVTVTERGLRYGLAIREWEKATGRGSN